MSKFPVKSESEKKCFNFTFFAAKLWQHILPPLLMLFATGFVHKCGRCDCVVLWVAEELEPR